MKVRNQENEVNSLIEMLNSLKSQVNQEHEIQEKIIKDLRNSLVTIPNLK